jgi:hypothetical protein
MKKDVCGCDNITDAGLRFIGEGCPALQQLNVCGLLLHPWGELLNNSV